MYGLISWVGSCDQNTAMNAAKARKEAKLIPLLVFEVEKFEAVVVKLGQKSKVDLLRLMKRATARDFRINVKDVGRGLAEAEEKEREKEDRAREKARERYVRKGYNQARRCYLRHLKMGRIANPGFATLLKWGVEPEHALELADADAPIVAALASHEEGLAAVEGEVVRLEGQVRSWSSYISAASRMHLGCILAVYRLYLGYISRAR